MRQLVNTACVVCGERIKSVIDARFCDGCRCPVHDGCVKPSGDDGSCATCGAAATRVEADRAVRQPDDYSPRKPGDPRPFRPGTYIACLVGSGIMTLSALRSTLDPRTDGRLLNTAPTLGFDAFLVLGIAGVAWSLFRLARGR